MRFKFASQNLIDFDFVKFETVLCMFVHVNTCVCVCVCLSNLLRFVADWVTNVLCSAKLRCESTTNRPESRKKFRLSCSFIHFIAPSFSIAIRICVVVAILISGCQYCYKFIGRIWVWLTSITKYQANTISSTSWKLFLFISSSIYFLFFPGFLLTFLVQYAQRACQMDGELPDVQTI